MNLLIQRNKNRLVYNMLCFITRAFPFAVICHYGGMTPLTSTIDVDKSLALNDSSTNVISVKINTQLTYLTFGPVILLEYT